MNHAPVVMGWDIGGAHLKVAVSADGQLLAVDSIATPVWQGLEVVGEAMVAASNRWPAAVAHRVTMTAELADIFTDRVDGVIRLIGLTKKVLGEQSVLYLNVSGGLCNAERALEDPQRIASANWVASVMLAASQFDRGVLTDVGSTTTDIIRFDSGQVITDGTSDLQRCRSQALLYLGVVRTPVCAWVDEIEFDGHRQTVASEYFANAADVYRLIDRLPQEADNAETCDGRGKTWRESRDRIARVLMTDADCHSRGAWIDVGERMASLQSDKIESAIRTQMGRFGDDAEGTVLVGAGIGRFLLPSIADSLEVSYRELHGISPQATDALPAAALAIMGMGGTSGIGGEINV